MISPSLLPERAYRWMSYGLTAERVAAYYPIAHDPLPLEYEEKLGDFTLPPPVIAELRDVHLAGPALVGFRGKEVILDTAYCGRLDVLERNFPYFELAHHAMAREPVRVPFATSFAGVWVSTYFHWLLEMLPRLEALEAWEKKHGERPTILLERDPPDFVLQSLDALGWLENAQPARADHYLVERLLVITTRRWQGRTSPSAVRWLADRSPDFPRDEDTAFYVPRDRARSRRVLNQRELLESVPDLYAINFELNVWIHQVKLARQGRVFVGPHGSGLANAIFSPRAAVVEIATPDYLNPCIFLLFSALDRPFGFVMGESVGNGKEDVRVDPAKFKRVYEEVLNAQHQRV